MNENNVGLDNSKMNEKKVVLDVKDLNVTYHNKQKDVYAVRSANFTIQEGDSVGIVGESGSGKSTMAMALLRLLNEDSTIIDGKADFLGKNLLTLSKEELAQIRWTQMAVVFQKAMNSLSPVHRIGTQFEDIYKVHFPKAKRSEMKPLILELFRMVNLPERVYRLYPHEMSGGMLQRVSIALSLMHHPKLLIFDEATTALDVVTQSQILEEITALEKKLDLTRIMITHDISVVAMSCTKMIVMYAGELLEIGNTKDILSKPLHPYTQGLLEAYPSLKGEVSQLSSIPGFLPDLSKKESGCIFASRCPYADEHCKTAKPEDTILADGRMVKCFRVKEAK